MSTWDIVSTIEFPSQPFYAACVRVPRAGNARCAVEDNHCLLCLGPSITARTFDIRLESTLFQHRFPSDTPCRFSVLALSARLDRGRFCFLFRPLMSFVFLEKMGPNLNLFKRRLLNDLNGKSRAKNHRLDLKAG